MSHAREPEATALSAGTFVVRAAAMNVQISTALLPPNESQPHLRASSSPATTESPRLGPCTAYKSRARLRASKPRPDAAQARWARQRFVKQLIERALKSSRNLLQRLDGWNGMAIFNAGNVAAKQARAFLGGVGGFYSLLEALQNPRHPQHEELLEWVGEEYDPEKFSIEAINRIRMEEKKRVARSSG